MKDVSFDELSMPNKMTLVRDFATDLCSMEFYDHRIYLYSLNAMMIEVYENIETKEIENIITIQYSDLDKYLSRITMSSLFAKSKAQN
ncbi:MAG TPA: hypothetical protein VGK59_18355 [Ohtaekwangia sp.]